MNATPAEIAAKAMHAMPSPIAETEFEPGYWRSCVTWAQIIETAAPAVIAALSEHYHLLPKAEAAQVHKAATLVIDMFRDVESRGEQLYYAPLHRAVDLLAEVLASAADVAEVKP